MGRHSQLGSDTTTDGVRVQAEPFFIPEETYPEDDRYFFGYRITITNVGGKPVQLISRRWVIIDGEGQSETVDGPGVVGYQPLLAPGQSFRYTSYCPLPTEWGTMEGWYVMEREDGSRFHARIGRFVLAMHEQQSSVSLRR